jgi:hypothetical protein
MVSPMGRTADQPPARQQETAGDNRVPRKAAKKAGQEHECPPEVNIAGPDNYPAADHQEIL